MQPSNHFLAQRQYLSDTLSVLLQFGVGLNDGIAGELPGELCVGVAFEQEPQTEIFLQLGGHGSQIIEIACAPTLETPLLQIFQRLVVLTNQRFHLSEVTLVRFLKCRPGDARHGFQGLLQFGRTGRFLTLEGLQNHGQLF
ncbi:hypothetical protein D3C75_1105630 [compost metagenome]